MPKKSKMDKILDPKKVKQKGRQKQERKVWKRFEAGARGDELGKYAVQKRRKVGSKEAVAARSALYNEGDNRRTQDIKRNRMAQERKWARMGIERPAYAEFQESVRDFAVRKSGKSEAYWKRHPKKYKKKITKKYGVGVDPAKIRAARFKAEIKAQAKRQKVARRRARRT